MSDVPDATVVEGLVERLTKDAERCSEAEKCVMPLMYCSFGPADRCDEIAELWLRALAERGALLAEHEAWKAWRAAEDAASKIPSDEEWLDLTRLEAAHQEAYDHAEKVIRGER